MQLDLRTVIVLLIGAATLIGGSLLLVARGYLGQVHGVSRWAAATLLQALGWTIYGPARGMLPEIVPIILGNGLICLSLAMYLLILAEFGQRVVKPWIPYGLVALQSGVLALLVLAGADVSSRIAVVSTCAVILMAMSSHVLLRGRSPRPVSHTLTGTMFGIAAAFGAVRALHRLMIWSTDRSMALFAPDLVTDLSFTAFFMTAIMFNFGFLLMVSDRYEDGRRLAEGRLRESEQRFKAIIEAEPECVKLVAPDGALLEMNPAGLAMLEADSVEQVRTRPLIDYLLPEYRPAFMALHRRNLTGEAGSMQFEVTGLRGTRRWLATHAVPMRDAGGRVSAVLDVTRDITERKTAEHAMRKSLEEQNALLKEVHHRVKNNLQVIMSLLRLEAGRDPQPDTKSVLATMRARIHAMALLHETLYRTGTFASVDLSTYLTQLANQSLRALSVDAGQVALDLEMASTHVEMDRAIPCGLLVNELISNCLKHGLVDGRTGAIRIELGPVDGSQIRLCVSDTGVGLPKDFDSKRNRSLGLQLTSDLARQLGGTLQVGPPPAAVFTVVFPA